VVRFEPALSKLVAVLREGRMTSDLEEGSVVKGNEGALGGGDLRLVVDGRDFPFLKKGTLMGGSLAADMIVQLKNIPRPNRLLGKGILIIPTKIDYSAYYSAYFEFSRRRQH
jgi:hypothetical protein